MKAILGGTGIDQARNFEGESKVIETIYGPVSYMEKDGIIYLPRHKKNHSVPPHKINYKANIKALKDLGVDEVVSIYAVGSISDKLKPLTYGIVDDFADFTGRDTTFFGGGDEGVRHISVSEPFSKKLQDKIEKCGRDIASDLVYVTTNGPRLETKAEIRAFSILGFDIVGMTLAQEAVLLKEAGIANAAIAYSINWAAGLEEEVVFVSDEDIEKLSQEIIKRAEDALLLSL